ncbi:MAG: aminotransferase class I/II-fold pyridoxal phosphate-dependent enzyme, partial [Myxococcota bacterium]
LYFPKGILSQSAEAREKAHRFDATLGIATEQAVPMHLASLRKMLGESLAPEEVFPYASPAGLQGLRERWREKALRENPSLRGKAFGLPVVTSAITHGLSLVGDLFVDPGDVLLLPDKLWGNYRLTYEVRLGARIETWPFYRGRGLDVEGFSQALARESEGREKLIVVLNFPNNPTGYMPSEAEGQAIVAALLAQAERGTRLVVVLDDAYFGLFYHLEGPTLTESLFGMLANAHPNLLAVRLDGATKEFFVWGLRCGFISVAPGRLEGAEEVAAVFDAKLRGAIRSGISNVPLLSQSLISRALSDSESEGERREKYALLETRARRAYEVASDPRYRDSWELYPFNSGYFMCVQVRGVEAEAVRVRLLAQEGIGVIATGGQDVRVAFSCLEVEDVQPLFEALHAVVSDLQ